MNKQNKNTLIISIYFLYITRKNGKLYLPTNFFFITNDHNCIAVYLFCILGFVFVYSFSVRPLTWDQNVSQSPLNRKKKVKLMTNFGRCVHDEPKTLYSEVWVPLTFHSLFQDADCIRGQRCVLHGNFSQSANCETYHTCESSSSTVSMIVKSRNIFCFLYF